MLDWSHCGELKSPLFELGIYFFFFCILLCFDEDTNAPPPLLVSHSPKYLKFSWELVSVYKGWSFTTSFCSLKVWKSTFGSHSLVALLVLELVHPSLWAQVTLKLQVSFRFLRHLVRYCLFCLFFIPCLVWKPLLIFCKAGLTDLFSLVS